MTTLPLWMSAADAAAALAVSRATLYAYVSRGYVRSQPTAGRSRERGYARADVEALRRRTEQRRNPDKAAARALQWGVPILESAITLIDGHALYYRGHDATELAGSRSLQEVASLLWTGRFDVGFAAAANPPTPRRRGVSRGLPFVARAQSALVDASSRDPLAFDARPGNAALCGWRIVHLLAGAAAGSPPAAPTIDQSLARAWRTGSRGIDPLRSALILCADHELNVSSFTERCVASAGSNPYAVVIAGLAALEGTRHGGASARVESMLAAMRRVRDLRGAIAARLRRGELIEGFGHPLYPGGDPRAAMLLDRLRHRFSGSAELAFLTRFADLARSAIGDEPNLDFALAALSRVLRLPSGSPVALFAIGRAIGWIAHAIEQYATGQLIRPRAKYIGVMPPVSG